MASDNMASSWADGRPAPYPPSEGERLCYFRGLTGPPSLLARTSGDVWPTPADLEEYDRNFPTHQTDKLLYNLGDHDIVTRWSSEVRALLIEALTGCDWRAFYPVRIGPKRTAAEQCPVVLMVHVAGPADPSTWSDLIKIALACRSVLEIAGIRDVEVEMQESHVVALGRHGSVAMELEAAIRSKHWLDAPADARTQDLHRVLPSPGCSIGPTEGSGAGSLGLFLRQRSTEQSSELYALTCRHVAVPETVDHDKDIDHTGTDGASRLKIGIPFATVDKILSDEEWAVSASFYKLKKLRAKSKRFHEVGDATAELSPEDEAELDRLVELEAEATETKAALKKVIEDAKSVPNPTPTHAVLGNVAYSPGLGLAPRGVVRDWALVKMDQSQISGPLENKAFIGQQAYRSERCAAKLLKRSGISEPRPELSAVLEDDDYMHCHGLAAWQPEKRSSIRVAKRGATTGLTFGLALEIEAVLREPRAGNTEFIAWSMLVISLEGMKVPFSERGDSGSCVWNYQGEVIGMVDSGVVAYFSLEEERRWRRRGKGRGRGRGELLRQCTTSADRKVYTDGDSALPTRFSEAHDHHDADPDFEKNTDVTFVTPLQWILEDIHTFTGHQFEIA